MKIVGFVVNPIAGMGGSVGLKGTDGDAYQEALRIGAKPVSPARATFLSAAHALGCTVEFLSWAGTMGENVLSRFSFKYSVGRTQGENVQQGHIKGCP